MSHITDIELKVTDLTALRSACKRMGFTLAEGKTTYEWYGRLVGEKRLPEGIKEEDLGKCLHAIQIPGAQYEVGIVSDPKGGYRLLWDDYERGGLVAVVGSGAGKLKQMYGLEKAKLEARKKGYYCTEKVLANGSITLEIQGGY